MYGRRVRCTSSEAVGHFDQAATGQAGHRTSRKHLLLWSCAAASLALSAQTLAQSTTLPQVTVEGKGTTAKKGTAKGAPKAAPQQPAAHPPAQPPDAPAPAGLARRTLGQRVPRSDPRRAFAFARRSASIRSNESSANTTAFASAISFPRSAHATSRFLGKSGCTWRGS
jgi:hypothetical protein